MGNHRVGTTMTTVASIEVRLKDRKVNEVGLSTAKPLTIGRRDDNELVLDLPTISSLHARIDAEDNDWVLTDLGSSNGVCVNGDPIKRRKLQIGDEVEIGPYTLYFSAVDKNLDIKATNPFVAPNNDLQTSDVGYVLEVLVENSDEIEQVIAINNRIKIGRGSNCDFSLDGDLTVSEEHLSIEKIPQGWIVKNLNRSYVTWLNKIPIRDQAPIQLGDVINVGNTRLRFATAASSTATASQTSYKHSTSSINNFMQIFSGPEGKRARIIVLTGLLVCILLSTFMFGGDDKTETKLEEKDVAIGIDADSNTEVVEDNLSTKRIRNRYLTWIHDLISKGEYELAVYRVEAGLQELPNDPQLTKLNVETRIAYANQLAEQKQYQAAISSLQALPQTDDPQVSNFLTLLQQRYLEEQREARRYEELDIKFGKQLQQIARNYEENKYAEAQEIATEMLASDDLNKFPEAKQVTKNWFEKLKVAIVQQKEQQQIALVKQEQLKQTMQEEYANCLKAEQEGSLVKAIQACNFVASADLDTPERAAAVEKINDLQAKLSSSADDYYKNGAACRSQNNLTCAMRNWHQTLVLNPNHEQASKGLKSIMPEQVKKAQTIYREGLVYEGLNNIPKAIAKWETVLTILPIEEELYHQKALNKLEEFGEK